MAILASKGVRNYDGTSSCLSHHEELGAERKRLAPKSAEAFKAFSQTVFADGASDIQTNPAGTNEAVQHLDKQYSRKIDQMLPEPMLKDIDEKVDMVQMERVLMEEGTKKFSEPQMALLKLIATRRASIR